jgi:hypothetical protein
MRLPRSRNAWALPIGIVAGILGFWGGSALISALVPRPRNPNLHDWAQVGMLFVIAITLVAFGRWYMRTTREPGRARR